MRIGIIGCGYVGTRAATFWTSLGHTLSVTTRNAAKIQHLSKVTHQVYLLTEDNFEGFVNDKEILLICVAPNQGENYRSTYLKTAQKIEKALQQKNVVKQILYTSSTSVYGDLQGTWAFESTPCRPERDKSAILLETEQVFLKCSQPHLKVCILRLGEIIGPGRSIIDRLTRLKTPLPGTGEHLTNLIHINDIIAALDFALNHELEGIYNLCNDLHIPRKELYTQLCREQDLPLPLWDFTLPQIHSSNRKVSNEKIKAAGFSFSHPTTIE